MFNRHVLKLPLSTMIKANKFGHVEKFDEGKWFCFFLMSTFKITFWKGKFFSFFKFLWLRTWIWEKHVWWHTSIHITINKCWWGWGGRGGPQIIQHFCQPFNQQNTCEWIPIKTIERSLELQVGSKPYFMAFSPKQKIMTQKGFCLKQVFRFVTCHSKNEIAKYIFCIQWLFIVR